LLIHSRLRWPPQIEIKEAFELLRRGQCDEFAAFLKSAALNDAVKQIRLEARDNVLEVPCIEDTLEDSAAVMPCLWRGTFGVLHGNGQNVAEVQILKQSVFCVGRSGIMVAG
jgi:hypothetical protein